MNISYNRQGEPTALLRSLVGFVGHIVADDFIGEVEVRGVSDRGLAVREYTPGDAGRGRTHALPLDSITALVIY